MPEPLHFEPLYTADEIRSVEARYPGFPGTARFTVSLLGQARAALFAATRHNPALGSRDRLTQHLRTATSNLALRAGIAFGPLGACIALVALQSLRT